MIFRISTSVASIRVVSGVPEIEVVIEPHLYKPGNPNSLLMFNILLYKKALKSFAIFVLQVCNGRMALHGYPSYFWSIGIKHLGCLYSLQHFKENMKSLLRLVVHFAFCTYPKLSVCQLLASFAQLLFPSACAPFSSDVMHLYTRVHGVAVR